MNKIIVQFASLLLLDRLLKSLALYLDTNSWFTLFLNDGIVFSVFKTSPIIIILSIALMLSVVYLLVTSQNMSKLNQFALILVLAGGSSNLFDRLKYGSIIDYINLGGGVIFNLADVYIVLGMVFLVGSHWYKSPTSDSASLESEIDAK